MIPKTQFFFSSIQLHINKLMVIDCRIVHLLFIPPEIPVSKASFPRMNFKFNRATAFFPLHRLSFSARKKCRLICLKAIRIEYVTNPPPLNYKAVIISHAYKQRQNGTGLNGMFQVDFFIPSLHWD